MGDASLSPFLDLSVLNSLCRNYSIYVVAGFFILGCLLGSFLNVLALRCLKEESIMFPASYCPECKHPLAPYDNIPILSYMMLGGNCRYCKRGIHWQYPLVEFFTGLSYAAIAYVFLVQEIHVANFEAFQIIGNTSSLDYTHDLFQAIQHAIQQGKSGLPTLDSPDFPAYSLYKYGLAIGAFVFASTLITVTVTDFREKLIPHEITYPSMLFGIAFSAIIRGDLLGAMAGIGASYIIFDFLAFYGLKLYMLTHPEAFQEEKPEEPEAKGDEKQNCETADEEKQGHDNTCGDDKSSAASQEDEGIEVMGGGDAVLSAVMSAYLGWQGLVLALVIGFLTGTLMGLGLLLVEMKKAGLMKECAKRTIIFGGVGALALGGLSFLMMPQATNLHITTASMGLISGALLGMVLVGTRVSKPFPFGPALALGGFIAMFLIPYWLPFYGK